MSDRQQMFRNEALEHRESARTQGNVVRLGSRWTSVAFWVLLGLFILGIIMASTIRIERHAGGVTAAGETGSVVVLIPAALAPEVATGSPVELGNVTTEVVASDQDILYPPEVQDRFGVDLTVPSIALVTSATWGDDTPNSGRVLIESEPLIVALVPGLKGLLGSKDG